MPDIFGRVLDRLEASFLVAVISMCTLLGPVRASNFGGWIARRIGPLLPVSRVAEQNLRRALPHLDAAARRRTIAGMWDNLGRTAAEFPHLGKLPQLPSLTSSGPGWYSAETHMLENLARTGTQAIFFTGHIGNWEMTVPVAAQLGVKISIVFRAASNPHVDRLITQLRHQSHGIETFQFPKGSKGARGAFAHLSKGGNLGLLMDQKLNDGIAVPFFGRPAMTAPSLAVLALRFQCLVIPARIDRLGPARFNVVLDPPLELPNSGDRKSDILELTTRVNQTLERWITARPEAWLWVHRRWPKD